MNREASDLLALIALALFCGSLIHVAASLRILLN